MSEPWHGINDPGAFWKPESAPADNTRVAYETDPVPGPQKEPAPTEVRLSEGKFLPPDGGLKFNDKCKVRVKVEYLCETLLKKITFSLFCISSGKTETMKPDKEGCENNGVAETEFQLFYPEDYKQGDKADFFFKASHRRGEKVIESEKLTLPSPTLVIPWIFDCHMHINSGHCAPLPLSKSKVPIPFMNQKRLDFFGSVALGDFGKLQKQSSDIIGEKAVETSKEILSSPVLKVLGEPEKRRRVLVNMPMNMDYAHYRGYEGRMIYENVGGEIKWWNEKEGKYENVSEKDYAAWEPYKIQKNLIKKAIATGNGALVSFYHYDPRAHLSNWHSPFDKNLVQTASPSNFSGNFPAVGIKMYTALGYSPLDPKLKFPWNDYYDKCATNQIPIVCHGSRGGMTTHDILLYYDHEHPNNTNVADTFKQSWFTDNFVSPYAWEPVLKKHQNLRLCLAHFGGDTFWDKSVNPVCDGFWQDLSEQDPKNWIAGFLHLMKSYPNFYVDLAYFLFEPSMTEYFKKALSFDPVVKERILFGTDWWLFTMTGKYKSGGYLKYLQNMCDRILAINDTELFKKISVKDAHELLAYFTTINPMRFLQLKKLSGKLAEAFNKDELVMKNNGTFELADWINEVPETIKDFYK